MIDGATLAPAPSPPERDDRWRRWWLLFFVLLLVVPVGFAVGRGLDASQPVPSSSLPAPAFSWPAPPPVWETTTTPAKAEPRKVPTHGSSAFVYASKRGPVHGRKGPLRRFRVAVERGSGENPEAFAEAVDAVLGDNRSWIGGGQVRLQLVSGSDAANFTVLLATRDTAYRMCLRGGTNIRVGRMPYTSCRTTGKAIINLDRWWLSSGPYLAAGMPLATYRQYVINHEVGHELGHHHQGCPKAGGPAPVMVQQTLTLRGCRPNAWPRAGNRLLTGPSL